jgi:hypothetical protein
MKQYNKHIKRILTNSNIPISYSIKNNINDFVYSKISQILLYDIKYRVFYKFVKYKINSHYIQQYKDNL